MQSKQPQRRIAIQLRPAEYEELRRRAESLDTTIATVVRRALCLPEYSGKGERSDLKNNAK